MHFHLNDRLSLESSIYNTQMNLLINIFLSQITKFTVCQLQVTHRIFFYSYVSWWDAHSLNVN